jgi:Sec-independent protein translocase protein TatA
MIGLSETTLLIVVAGIIFFFGKGKVLEWARSIGEVKKEYAESKKEISERA